MDALTTIS